MQLKLSRLEKSLTNSFIENERALDKSRSESKNVTLQRGEFQNIMIQSNHLLQKEIDVEIEEPKRQENNFIDESLARLNQSQINTQLEEVSDLKEQLEHYKNESIDTFAELRITREQLDDANSSIEGFKSRMNDIMSYTEDLEQNLSEVTQELNDLKEAKASTSYSKAKSNPKLQQNQLVDENEFTIVAWDNLKNLCKNKDEAIEEQLLKIKELEEKLAHKEWLLKNEVEKKNTYETEIAEEIQYTNSIEQKHVQNLIQPVNTSIAENIVECGSQSEKAYEYSDNCQMIAKIPFNEQDEAYELNIAHAQHNRNYLSHVSNAKAQPHLNHVHEHIHSHTHIGHGHHSHTISESHYHSHEHEHNNKDNHHIHNHDHLKNKISNDKHIEKQNSLEAQAIDHYNDMLDKERENNIILRGQLEQMEDKFKDLQRSASKDKDELSREKDSQKLLKLRFEQLNAEYQVLFEKFEQNNMKLIVASRKVSAERVKGSTLSNTEILNNLQKIVHKWESQSRRQEINEFRANILESINDMAEKHARRLRNILSLWDVYNELKVVIQSN